MRKFDHDWVLVGQHQGQIHVPDQHHGRNAEPGGNDQPLAYGIAEVPVSSSAEGLRREHADDRQQRHQDDQYLERQVAGDADSRQRVVAKLADDHLGSQEHRELGQVSRR